MIAKFALKVTVLLVTVFSISVAASPSFADSTITDKEDCESNLLGTWTDTGSDGLGECHH